MLDYIITIIIIIMSSSSSSNMYQRIMGLATQLRQETSVKKRRDMGQELLEQLRDDRVRKKLLAEATFHASRRRQRQQRRHVEDDTTDDDDGDESSLLSVPLRRWHALTQMWRVIILNALVATKMIASSSSSSGGMKTKRVKLTKEDILLPYHLLRLCDQHLPYCRPEEDQLLIRPKLHQNEVKELFHYCLDMLSLAAQHREAVNDAAREGGRAGASSSRPQRRGGGGGEEEHAAVAAVEIHLLEMMFYLCSRIEHVAHYRPDEDMSSILGEVVEGRLFMTSKTTTTDDRDKAIMAAKIMDALLTSCQKLGIGLHHVMSNGIHLLSKWATLQQQQQEEAVSAISSSSSIMITSGATTTLKMLPYLLHAATVLLMCHPEMAIVPMTACGRPILTVALKYYTKSSTSVQKEAFHDYFMAHM